MFKECRLNFNNDEKVNTFRSVGRYSIPIMKKQQLAKLINKYLEGKCSPDEELLLEEYLDSLNDKKNSQGKRKLSYEELTGEETYSRIIQAIDNMKKGKTGLQKIVASRYLLKIAASIIALLTLSVCALYISGVFSSNSNQVAWTERKTISGEKSIINFADGTKIILNGNSNLKYSVNALNNTREVFLEGEAFFEVKHDTTRQFIVHSKNLTTTDLGTEFDISAYSNEKEITVSLVSGKINIAENENEKISKSTILQPKQQLVYSTTKKTYNLRDFDMVEIIGWKDNVLKFKDATLKDVFIKLERAYGIKFQLQTKSFEGFLITANFDKAPVETVTKLIKKLTGLDYTNIKENDQIKKIVFFKK